MHRENVFTKFLYSTNTQKNLHLFLCFCLFFMKPFSEGKPLRSSWPVQVQGSGIPGNVHCSLSLGARHPHTQKIQICAQLPAINSRSKEPQSWMCFGYYHLCLWLPEGLSNNVVFNYFNERENDLRSVSSMRQGPDGNAKSGIISSAVNSTLSEVIGAKCKQLLEPDWCQEWSWGNKLGEALNWACVASSPIFCRGGSLLVQSRKKCL